MAEEPRTKEQLSEEEVEAQDGEELPDRETMMLLDLGPDVGIQQFPVESEAPDDRYEQ
jgi:hypothetical protein